MDSSKKRGDCLVDSFINITDIELNILEEILVEKNGEFQNATIVDIRLNDQTVKSAKTGEIGLQLSIPIKKKSILWKKPVTIK